MKKQMQKGFSLVELMVVIAIIAILAAVAIPMYSNYTTRANISSSISTIGGVKAEVGEALNNQVAPSGANFSLPSGASIQSATTSGATIRLAVGADGKIDSTATNYINYTATAANNSVTWNCTATGAGLSASKVPSICTYS